MEKVNNIFSQSIRKTALLLFADHCSSKDQSHCSRPSPPSPEPIRSEICYEYGDLIGRRLPRGDDVIEGEVKLERNISLLTGNVDKIFVSDFVPVEELRAPNSQ